MIRFWREWWNRRDREKFAAEFQDATNQIAGKWRYYNETLSFKDTMPLAEIIRGFAIPIHQFWRLSYPTLAKQKESPFWVALFLGITKANINPDKDLGPAFVSINAEAFATLLTAVESIAAHCASGTTRTRGMTLPLRTNT